MEGPTTQSDALLQLGFRTVEAYRDTNTPHGKLRALLGERELCAFVNYLASDDYRTVSQTSGGVPMSLEEYYVDFVRCRVHLQGLEALIPSPRPEQWLTYKSAEEKVMGFNTE